MEQENKMMCPFRHKDNGDFEPCYGKGCMAYYEWTSYVNTLPCQVINSGCKMFAPHIGNSSSPDTVSDFYLNQVNCSANPSISLSNN